MDIEVIKRTPDSESSYPPLLCIHGGFHAAWCWDEYFLPYFAKCGIEAHALSLRGHGESDGRERIDAWSLADYCDDVLQVSRSLASPPILLGHSIGAVIAQQCVQSFDVPGIIMIAPTPLSRLPLAKLRWAFRFPITTMKMLLRNDINAALPAHRKLFFSPEMSDDQTEQYMQRMQRESNRVFEDIAQIRDPNPMGVRCPALILAAEHDRIPRRVNQTLADAFHADLHTLPFHHDMMLDSKWRTVADQVVNWVKGLEASHLLSN